MSKRQASTIIALLIVIAGGLFVLAGPGASRGQNEVSLPIVVNEQSPQVRAPGRVYPSKNDLGLMVERAITEDSPSDDKALSDAMQELVAASAGKDEPVTLGPSTAGMVMEIAGKLVALPKEFYISNIVSHLTCEVGQPCPATPIYVVSNGAQELAISGATGEIATQEADDALRSTFAPVISQIEVSQ